MFAVVLAVTLFATAASAPLVDSGAERTVMQDVNQERARAHVGALVSDEDLHAIAVARADDMAARHYFDHKTPEGTVAFVDALRRTAFHFTAAGENIALAPTVEVAEQGLWNSPGHRENMLDSRFSRAGIAVVWVGPEVYVIEVFAD